MWAGGCSACGAGIAEKHERNSEARRTRDLPVADVVVATRAVAGAGVGARGRCGVGARDERRHEGGELWHGRWEVWRSA